MVEKKPVALVTGSSRGIGKEIALELARLNYTVVVNGENASTSLFETAYDIREVSGNVLAFFADVSKVDEVQDMFKKTVGKFGAIDLLVNNAGIIADKIITDMTLEEWNRVLDVNLTGTFLCTREAIKHMKAQRYGRIINIASVVGQSGNIGQCNYAASKGGVIAFTKSIAKECARYGILVNAIAPGFIKTEMLNHVPHKVLERFVDQIPLRHLGKPSDVAKLVKFLASEDASYITGQTINVDGGYYV